MSDMTGLGDLVAEVKKASENITQSDNVFTKRLDGIEGSVNELFRRTGRPGGFIDGSTDECKEALEMCRVRHSTLVAKHEDAEYAPRAAEVDQAISAQKALSQYLRHGDLNRLAPEYRKSLSAFSFGPPGNMLLPPVQANRILSCLVSPTDLSGLFDQVTIAGPTLEFFIDNARMGLGAWSCEASCFANNPQPDLSEGLGRLTIKPETIRFVVCATRDLVEDAGFNFENWLYQKISDGMRITINHALCVGDGVGKPLGILNPKAGVPICETSAATPAGQFSFQDLIMLLYQLPMEFHQNATWIMNQQTFALLLSQTDAMGRPMITPMPQGAPTFTLVGRPVVIATQMPDPGPGSTPIAVGDWKRAFTVVTRKAPTIQVDPYSSGFCLLFKAEARVGSGATCPNACRLLRIR
jgi:HK97 family phage major capsid protein